MIYRKGFGQVTGAVTAVVPVNILPTTPTVTCFKLFGDMEGCIGPIGAMTLFLGLGVGALLMMFGGGRGR